MDDQELLQRMKRGDDGVLNSIITRYSAYIYTIVSNILRDRLGQEDVEEVVSDVFLSLWNSRKRVGPISLQAYLVAIARNAAKNKLRAMKLAVPLEDDVLSVQDPAASMDEAVLRRELEQQVREAVDAMGEPDREIFLRYYYFYQKTAEIAQQMELSEPVVRIRLHRGRKKLRLYLRERGYLDEDPDC